MSEGLIPEFLAWLKATSWLARDLVWHQEIPARAATFGRVTPWPAPVRRALELNGIKRLYSHQCAAMEQLRAGHHTVVATPTASGKSLIYNLPVLEACCLDQNSRALYLFPLKALAQDQRRSLEELFARSGLYPQPSSAIYDGDTSAHHRAKIRTTPPHVLFTNPDMLHLGIMPGHEKWMEFFANLRFVVVDEVHTYRGIMGSHMAWVFRRLIRLCRLYGAEPTFLCASATIANPRELSEKLTGLAMQEVLESGAGSPKKHMLLMNGVEGAAQKAIGLVQEALTRGLRTIVYCKSRKMTELIALWAGQRNAEDRSRISAYRAGFLPDERRDIEARLASGELLVVISTSALELGIDIGGLDLCILVGYPGSIMATWQRSGRVGRSGQEAATVFIGHEDALDQYFMNNPQEFFSMEPERAVINPENPVIAARHLECAAAELSLRLTESFVRESEGEALELALREGVLLKSGDGQELLSRSRQPHRQVALRGTGSTFAIVDMESGERIGMVDGFRAIMETHPGAVYLHRGVTYVVIDLDQPGGMVRARRAKVDYYTRVRHEKSTEILEIQAERIVHGTRVCLGKVRVTDLVTGYDRISVRGGKNLGTVPLDMEPLVFTTQGVWIAIPEDVRRSVENEMLHFMGGIHAFEHAAIGMMPLLVLADRNDLGGISTPLHPQVGSGAVFIYDGLPGGCGLVAQAYVRYEELLARTLGVIRQCPCESGCPACVHSPKCGSGNRPIHKTAALRVLELILATPTSVDLIPRMPESSIQTSLAVVETEMNYVMPSELRFAVLDLETRRSAQDVGGWHRADLMGVSCVVVYDSGADAFVEYLQDDIPRLVGELVEYDLVVGFNISRFDYAVLSGLSRFDFNTLPTLDILQDIHARLGYRLSLDHLAQATLGAAKSASGLQALTWWKEGRIRDIIDYCRQDVAVTRDLFLYGLQHEHLIFHNKAGKAVQVPVTWRERMMR